MHWSMIVKACSGIKSYLSDLYTNKSNTYGKLNQTTQFFSLETILDLLMASNKSTPLDCPYCLVLTGQVHLKANKYI